MRTTPKGEMYAWYEGLTKGELFHTALSYFQLKHPDKATDFEEFKKFCKKETRIRKVN